MFVPNKILEIQINYKQAFWILRTLQCPSWWCDLTVLGTVMLAHVQLYERQVCYMPSTKNTNAIPSKYLTLQQYILKKMIVWLPSTKKIPQESALILYLALVECFWTLRIKNFSSSEESTQNIHVLDGMNKECHY